MASHSFYLKLLNDFCQNGQVPVVSKGIDDDKPWLKKDDPLLDFLLSLMRKRHYQQHMLHSRLRAKVFYSAVGKFVWSVFIMKISSESVRGLNITA